MMVPADPNTLGQVRRLLAVSVAPVVIAVGVILYGFPSRTAELFAWPIMPTLTPLVMLASTIIHWERFSHSKFTFWLWPWKLTPVTARVIGGWILVSGVGGLPMCLSKSARQWHVALETATLWFVLILIALPGARSDFATPNGMIAFSATLSALSLLFAFTWASYRFPSRAVSA